MLRSAKEEIRAMVSSLGLNLNLKLYVIQGQRKFENQSNDRSTIEFHRVEIESPPTGVKAF